MSEAVVIQAYGESDYEWCLYAKEHGRDVRVAAGWAPDEATARLCGELVTHALDGGADPRVELAEAKRELEKLRGIRSAEEERARCEGHVRQLFHGLSGIERICPEGAYLRPMEVQGMVREALAAIGLPGELVGGGSNGE